MKARIPKYGDNGAYPAYPGDFWVEVQDSKGNTRRDVIRGGGVSKREYISALCLQGLLANPIDSEIPHEAWAVNAVVFADALIKALEGKEPEEETPNDEHFSDYNKTETEAIKNKEKENK